MKRSKMLVATLALLAVAGCNKAVDKPAPPAPAVEAPAPPAAGDKAAAGTKMYGAPLTAAEPMAIGDLLSKPDGWKSRTVTVEGKVRKACTRKGCWMEVAASDKEGTPGCRVTFKDYGFFVPLDSAGSAARVQGTVEVDTLSASAVRHYEEEGMVFASKRPDGTAPEVRIVATGVELTRTQ